MRIYSTSSSVISPGSAAATGARPTTESVDVGRPHPGPTQGPLHPTKSAKDQAALEITSPITRASEPIPIRSGESIIMWCVGIYNRVILSCVLSVWYLV